jgi:hypothetical protein
MATSGLTSANGTTRTWSSRAHCAHNPKVAGSNPAPATNWDKGLSGFRGALLLFSAAEFHPSSTTTRLGVSDSYSAVRSDAVEHPTNRIHESSEDPDALTADELEQPTRSMAIDQNVGRANTLKVVGIGRGTGGSSP